MSPALNGSSAIQRFEVSDAIEIRDGITLDFYTGLPHMYTVQVVDYRKWCTCSEYTRAGNVENRTVLVSNCM